MTVYTGIRGAFQHTVLQPADQFGRACFCTGPQNGAPLCPCLMRESGLRAMLPSVTPKPRVRVKAVSRPSTPEARNG